MDLRLPLYELSSLIGFNVIEPRCKYVIPLQYDRQRDYRFSSCLMCSNWKLISKSVVTRVKSVYRWKSVYAIIRVWNKMASENGNFNKIGNRFVKIDLSLRAQYRSTAFMTSNDFTPDTFSQLFYIPSRAVITRARVCADSSGDR